MTLNDHRENYDAIRAELLRVKSTSQIQRLYSMLDFALIQINAMLSAAPETIR